MNRRLSDPNQLRNMRHTQRKRFGSLCFLVAIICCPLGVYFIYGGMSRAVQTTARSSVDVDSSRHSHDSVFSPTVQQLNPVTVITNNNNNNNIVINGLSAVVMTDNMTDDEADLLYFEFIQHLDAKCEQSTRIGNTADGGWNVCIAGTFQITKPCLVYSFGINWDFSFDDAVSKQLGCTVRSFDPSMAKAVTHRRDENIWFYTLGISGNDTVSSEGWTLKTFQSLVNMLNDSRKTIDYLKMDVENSEWASLEAMYQSGVLARVKQLAMEIHVYPFKMTNAAAFYERWKTLKRLEEFGFRRWYWHLNDIPVYQYNGRLRSCCYEMIYINTNYINANFNKSPSSS